MQKDQSAQQKRASISQTQTPPQSPQQSPQQSPRQSRSNSVVSQTSDASEQTEAQIAVTQLSMARFQAGKGLIYGLETKQYPKKDRRYYRAELSYLQSPGFQTVDQLNGQTRKGKDNGMFPYDHDNGYPQPSQLPDLGDKQKQDELIAHVTHQSAVENRFHPTVRYGALQRSSVPDGVGDREDVLIKRNNRAALTTQEPIVMDIDGLKNPRDSGVRYTESEMRFIGRNQHRLQNISFFNNGDTATDEEVTQSLASYRGRSASDVDDDRYFLTAQNPPMTRTNFKLPPSPPMSGAMGRDRSDSSPRFSSDIDPNGILLSQHLSEISSVPQTPLNSPRKGAKNGGFGLPPLDLNAVSNAFSQPIAPVQSQSAMVQQTSMQQPQASIQTSVESQMATVNTVRKRSGSGSDIV